MNQLTTLTRRHSAHPRPSSTASLWSFTENSAKTHSAGPPAAAQSYASRPTQSSLLQSPKRCPAPSRCHPLPPFPSYLPVPPALSTEHCPDLVTHRKWLNGQPFPKPACKLAQNSFRMHTSQHTENGGDQMRQRYNLPQDHGQEQVLPLLSGGPPLAFPLQSVG